MVDCVASDNSAAMEGSSGADRSFDVLEYHKNGDSAAITRRKFFSHRGLHILNDAPSTPLFRKLSSRKNGLVDSINHSNLSKTFHS